MLKISDKTDIMIKMFRRSARFLRNREVWRMAGNVFERSEIKYLVKNDIFEDVFRGVSEYMHVDKFGFSTIMNIYYDTENYDIIRESLDKPVYKEKIRLRSYGIPGRDSTVFLELKKKYQGVVYKRREVMKYSEALSFLATGVPPRDGQIMREIAYFINTRKITPSVVLCYDRVAMFGYEDPEQRVTFDEAIRYRFNDFDLSSGDQGELLLKNDDRLMEIKLSGAMPFWLVGILEKNGLYPTTFSKYGRIYTENFIKLHTGKVLTV